ncbi:M20 family metallo-hydrolase [Virgibacillus necropolis]|uniref:Allantoate amidohydrolase n=1 Tax=Virgibacillus necropolis TaxID=163877 RepID=A0A221MEZ3_9BACI|nr:M20 family metallo-hydrolase [Virgibacillus necropolis]ASN06204.1 allantoate amidohydrolase [Virgibacillus necropolis]
MDTSKERIQNTLDQFNVIGPTEQGIQRLAYTKEEKRAHELLIELCSQEKMNVRIDEAGNVIARRAGRLPNAPAVAVGSHLDTVYTGGKFDGTAGVVAGLELIRRLNEKDAISENPIELICFAAEESSRFGMSTIGSKAMVGKMTKEEMEKLKDKMGIKFTDAIKSAGLDKQSFLNAKKEKNEYRAFIELHIEQGLELEQSNKKIAIVTGIASPTRLNVVVLGRAAHSGTTSMEMRKDALVAAAQLVLEIEKAAKKEKKYKTVATVGVFDVSPGAMNVVPGMVQLKVDIRGLDNNSKQRVITEIEYQCKSIQRCKDIEIKMETISKEEPVHLDKEIQEQLKWACEDIKVEALLIPSGAGHDAMNMANLCPTGLLFIPSYKGISHNPEEYSDIDDLVTGVDVLERVVTRLAVTKERGVKQ